MKAIFSIRVVTNDDQGTVEFTIENIPFVPTNGMKIVRHLAAPKDDFTVESVRLCMGDDGTELYWYVDLGNDKYDDSSSMADVVERYAGKGWR